MKYCHYKLNKKLCDDHISTTSLIKDQSDHSFEF